MIEIVDDEGRILGLMSERPAMPVQRRDGGTLRVWVSPPVKLTSQPPTGPEAVSTVVADELTFVWRQHHSRWYLRAATPIPDYAWEKNRDFHRIEW